MAKKTSLFFVVLCSIFFSDSSFAQNGDSLTLICAFESGNHYEFHFAGAKLEGSQLGPLVIYKDNIEFQRFDSYLSLPTSFRASNSNSYKYDRKLGSGGSYQVTNKVEILIDRITGELEYTARSGLNGILGKGQKSKGTCRKKIEPKLSTKF